MSQESENEIFDALSVSPENMEFEEPLEASASPLNQPVVNKELKNHMNGHNHNFSDETGNNKIYDSDNVIGNADEEPLEQYEYDGVPEQEFQNEGIKDKFSENFEVPESHLEMEADAYLGYGDLGLEIGGGFFVRIKKHKDFFDFDEVIQVIDELDEKNINRMKLDETDKAFLRPLIIEVLKKKTKRLTPEQLLIQGILAIATKKFQLLMQIRKENNMAIDRLIDHITEIKTQERKLDNQQHNPTKKEEGIQQEDVTYDEEQKDSTPTSNKQELNKDPEFTNEVSRMVLEVADEEDSNMSTSE